MDRKPLSKMFTSNIAIFLVLIFVFAVVTFAMNLVWLGIIEFVIWIALTVYTFLHEAKMERDMTEYMQNLSFHTDNATKASLLSFPLPLVVVQPDSTIIWYNEPFQKIVGSGGLFEKKLSELLEEPFDIDTVMKLRDKDGLLLHYQDHYYNIRANSLQNDSPEMYTVLYWTEVTELIRLKKRFEDTRPVVATMIIDNYDELIQNTPEDSSPILVATMEKRVTEWASRVNGVFKRMARDRYLFVFDHKYLQEFITEKFNVLDSIRSINVGNKIPATMSIGIGVDGETMAQSDVFAKSALDMALGRGGDQVVIKDKQKFTYFGGSSKDVEKHTRVKTRVMAYALKQLFAQSENVVIMGHRGADLDSLGSAVGLYSAVKKMGKPVKIVLETANHACKKLVEQMERSGEFQDALITHAQAVESVTRETLLVVVDVYRADITECPVLLEQTDNVVVLDHHRKSANFIERTALTYHEPYASSTSEMVTELLQYIDEGESLTKTTAEALYSGIALDTKNFTFKTGVRTFEAAAYLRQKGIDPSAVKQLFQNNMDLYKMKSDIVVSAQVYRKNIAIAVNTNQCDDMVSIVASAADELLGIDGITASFVLSKTDDIIHISGRSLGEINVQLILELLGGGGHSTVAGAQVEGTIQEVKEKLKEAIDTYFENQKQG